LKTAAIATQYSPARIAAQVARMGREISRDHAGQTLHVVAVLEDAFVFASDLVRHITCPVVCHFVRPHSQEVSVGGFLRKEIFFSPEPDLKGKDVLLVEAMLDTGITTSFLTERLRWSRPRSMRLAVLLNRPQSRRVALLPDYWGFEAASKFLVGYGLPGRDGLYRNLPYVGALDGRGRASQSKGKSARKRKGK
jgi:hypoxanthine phosphoribosyltransferase